MTKTARSLGMTRTTFRNASGLPNPGQVTTARDMATLGLRIQRDFPNYYHYFSIRSFTYKGRVVRTHNRLLGRFQGADGIKTGYIRASGFNLTTSAARGDKRVIGVVMGAASGGARNQYMMKMLEKQFAKAKSSKNKVWPSWRANLQASNPKHWWIWPPRRPLRMKCRQASQRKPRHWRWPHCQPTLRAARRRRPGQDCEARRIASPLQVAVDRIGIGKLRCRRGRWRRVAKTCFGLEGKQRC